MTRRRSYTEAFHGDNEPIRRLEQMERRVTGTLFTSKHIDAAMDVRALMLRARAEGLGSPALSAVIAMRSHLGDDMFDVLHDFLLLGRCIEQIERDKRWPKRSAKVVLSIALDRVAAYELSRVKCENGQRTPILTKEIRRAADV